MNAILKNILDKLGKIPADKLLHFIAGALIAAFFALVVPTGRLWCIGPVVLAAIAKEIYDEVDYGGFDWADIGSTVLGGLIIQVFAWV